MKKNIKLLIAIACLVCCKTDRIAAMIDFLEDFDTDTNTDTNIYTDTDENGNQGTSTGSSSFDVTNQQSGQQTMVQPVTLSGGNNSAIDGFDLNEQGIFEITTDEDDNQIDDDDEYGQVEIITDEDDNQIDDDDDGTTEVDLSNAAKNIKENPTDPRTFSEALEKINAVIADKSLTPIQAFSEFFQALGDLLSTVLNEIVTAFRNIPSLQSSIEESIPANTSDLSSERINAITDSANNPNDVAGALAILGIDKTDISLVTQADITAAQSDPSFQKYQYELITANGSSLFTFAKIILAVSTLQDAITPISTTFDPVTDSTTRIYPDDSIEIDL